MTQVLYIGGWARSGSTLLANLLGSVHGFVSVGELRDIWRLGMLENQPCGCGEAFSDCPFWRGVLTRLHAAIGTVDPEAMAAVQHHELRVRHSPRLVGNVVEGPFGGSQALARYVEVMGALYTAISAEAAGAVVVDSSKYPADAALLRSCPGVRPVYLHLVRDPRAVAYSWRRFKVRTDRDEPIQMPIYGTVFSTANWLAFNVLFELLRRRASAPSALLRYEDLVRDPQRSLEQVLTLVGARGRPLPVEGAEAKLEESHTVNGNPDRRGGGTIRIRPDVEWENRLAQRDRVVASLLAAPLLRRYGYPWA